MKLIEISLKRLLLQKLALAKYGFTSDSNTTSDKRMANNLLKIQVYFSSKSIEVIEETPKYQASAFLNT